MHEWKQMLIRKAYTDFSNSPAMEWDAKQTLLIATDEKTNTKSGGG